MPNVIGAKASVSTTAWHVAPSRHSASDWQTGIRAGVHAAKHSVTLKSPKRRGAGHVVLVLSAARAGAVAFMQQIPPLGQRGAPDDAQPSSFSPPRHPDAFVRHAPWVLMQHTSPEPHAVPLPHGTVSVVIGARPVVQPPPGVDPASGCAPASDVGLGGVGVTPESVAGVLVPGAGLGVSSLPQPVVEAMVVRSARKERVR